MILEAVSPYRARDVAFKQACEEWELRGYWRLRRRIFCDEQRLFAGDDSDAFDQRAVPIVAVSRMAGMPDEVVGVVRIWEQEAGHWWGGRLGTDPRHRRDGTIGPGLVDLAVRTACRRICRRFSANVQMRNVELFRRLHWRMTGETVVCGVPHASMEADLAHYRAGLS